MHATEAPDETAENRLADLTREALTPLRMMRLCETYELLHVEGRDQTPKPGRTLILRRTVNGDTFNRVLYGDELYGYAAGALAADGLAHLIDQADSRTWEPPRLLTVDEAAQAFTLPTVNPRTGLAHLTRDGVISKIHRREFEVIYFERRQRMLFEAEIRALRHGATEPDRQAWREMAEWLALGRRLKITPANLPMPGYDYPISDAKPHVNRCLDSMLIGFNEGWFRYEEPSETPAGLQFHIFELAGHPGKPVTVPESYALQWLLGVADHFSPTAGAIVAYRHGIA